MNDDELLYEKTVAWLTGKLPPGEAQTFERDMAADPALAREVELHRLTFLAIQRMQRQEIRARIQLIAAVPPRRRLALWAGWLGLSALLLAGLLFFYKWPARNEPAPPPTLPARNEPAPPTTVPVVEPGPHPKKAPNYIALAEKLHRMPTAADALRLRGADGSDELFAEKLDSAWHAKDFRTATALLREVPPGANLRVQELLGHALFQTQKFAEAAEAFRTVAEQPGPSQGAARFNLLLCLSAEFPAHKQEVAQLMAELLKDDLGKQERRALLDLKAALELD